MIRSAEDSKDGTGERLKKGKIKKKSKSNKSTLEQRLVLTLKCHKLKSHFVFLKNKSTLLVIFWQVDVLTGNVYRMKELTEKQSNGLGDYLKDRGIFGLTDYLKNRWIVRLTDYLKDRWIAVLTD